MGFFDRFKKNKNDLSPEMEEYFEEQAERVGREKYVKIVSEVLQKYRSGLIDNPIEETEKAIQKAVNDSARERIEAGQNALKDALKRRYKLEDIDLEKTYPNPEETELDEIPQGVGKFGLEATNPIPVNGIPGIHEYLNELITSKEGIINYTRLGAFKVKNIPGMVDEYQIYNSSGDELCVLYFCGCYKKNSNNLPEGFYWNS